MPWRHVVMSHIDSGGGKAGDGVFWLMDTSQTFEPSGTIVSTMSYIEERTVSFYRIDSFK